MKKKKQQPNFKESGDKYDSIFEKINKEKYKDLEKGSIIKK